MGRIAAHWIGALMLAAGLTAPASSQEEPAGPPAPQGREYGTPIAVAVPDSVLKQMQDQDLSITRLRIYFEDPQGGGAKLQFEDLHTEVPVILAAFVGERCDRVLSHADWRARRDHFIDLGFQVKTLPVKLQGMAVTVEHSHLQGEVETAVAAYEVPKPEPGEPWNDLRIPGARPGVNRYRLVVSYTNSKNETTTHMGFSHWVVVQAPPMFEFTNTAHVAATRRKVGSETLLAADVRIESAFLLHHGLKPEECFVRVLRSGRRDLSLANLPPQARRIVEKERAGAGWTEVGKGPLTNPRIACIERATVEDSFVRLTFRHVINASSSALPLGEQWEYRFELRHVEMTEPLATWDARVNLEIPNAAAIDTAKLVLRATGYDNAIETQFAAKSR